MFDLAIFAALGWERRAVTDSLPGRRDGVAPGTWSGRLGDGSSCIVVQTGVGRERARVAASAVPPVRLFLACGCAGALTDQLRAGDLVVADRIDAVAAGGRVAERIAAHAPALTAWAASRGFQVHEGSVASTLGVLDTAEAKAAAGAGGALVVEMESAALATEARARGIPFVGLRVVLDLAAQAVPLPAGVVDEETGEVRTGRAVAGLALRPWVWPALGRLARQQRVAAQALGTFMAALLRDGGMEVLAGRPVPVAAGAGEGL